MGRRTNIPVAADPAYARRRAGACCASAARTCWCSSPWRWAALRPTRELAVAAIEAGLGVVVTSVFDTAVGVAGALHLAASLPGPERAHGLATVGLLEEAPVEGLDPPHRGADAVAEGAGPRRPPAGARAVNRDAPAVVAWGETLTYGALEARVAEAPRAGCARWACATAARVGLWAENSVGVDRDRAGGRRALGACWCRSTRGSPIRRSTGRWHGRRLPVVIAGDALAARAVTASRLVSLAEWRTLPSATPARAPATTIRRATRPSSSPPERRGGPRARCSRAATRSRAPARRRPCCRSGPGDRWLASLPFFHVGGLGIVQRCLLAGACVVLPAVFSADELGRSIEEQGVTHVSVVDATLRRILEARGGRALPDRVRAVVVGGGPVSPALLDACPQALASYGLTESCAMATLVRPGAPLAQRRTAGQALPGIDLRIAADGVIELRGPTVMRGYLDDPAATQAAMRDGWLRTGDLGELDADGCLRVLSRRDDLIISGGENVYPAEIEHALREHPDVADAVVIGVPDEQWGEVPLAIVELRSPGAPDLRAFLEPRLARYKLPRVEFVTEIPRLANGKPDRSAVRKRRRSGSTSSR